MLRLLVAPMLVVVVAGCASHSVRTSHTLPPAVQIDMLNLSRVWIAGFHVEDRREFDLNAETVRLLRAQLRAWSLADVIGGEPMSIDSEQRFSDIKYWHALGEEHGSPLIVTGSVKLLLAPPAIEQRGVRTLYFPMAGRVLEATVVLIDGRTGAQLGRQKLPAQMRYGAGRSSSGLSLYFQLMDRALPDWFRAIAGIRRP